MFTMQHRKHTNHKKKAQGLSSEMIVLAILALIVLAVVSYMIINQTTRGKQQLNDCQSKGGKCVDSAESCSLQGGSTLDLDCYEQGKKGEIIKAKKVCCYLDCEAQQGSCQDPQDTGGCADITKTIHYTNCDKQGKVCCLK